MDATTADAYYGKLIYKDLKIITKVLDSNFSKANIDEFIQEALHKTDEE